MDTESGDRLLRIGEMLVLTGYSRSSIYRKMRDGSFPQALKIGARAVRWQESEIVGLARCLSQGYWRHSTLKRGSAR